MLGWVQQSTSVANHCNLKGMHDYRLREDFSIVNKSFCELSTMNNR